MGSSSAPFCVRIRPVLIYWFQLNKQGLSQDIKHPYQSSVGTSEIPLRNRCQMPNFMRINTCDKFPAKQFEPYPLHRPLSSTEASRSTTCVGFICTTQDSFSALGNCTQIIYRAHNDDACAFAFATINDRCREDNAFEHT